MVVVMVDVRADTDRTSKVYNEKRPSAERISGETTRKEIGVGTLHHHVEVREQGCPW